MTDRLNALTVVLDHDIRKDDAEVLLQAIRLLRGVLSVQAHVADHAALIAEHRARRELITQLRGVLND